MDNWNINYMSTISLHKQLEKRIIISVQRGDLKLGDHLPSVKMLSRKLSLSLSTTSKVYRQLLKEGVLGHNKGTGYCIAAFPDTQRENSQ